MADAKTGKPSKPSKRIDIATIAGLAVGVGGILAGLILDGGRPQDVVQFNAALIVFGGTLGAVMVTTPLPVLIRSARRVKAIFISESHTAGGVIDEIIGYAVQARKQGIVSLEQQADAVRDPFLRKALNLAVDGIEMSQIRNTMELEISLLEQDQEAEAKTFEVAGGYSPTIGIIGAVLGLMQVMKNLANIDEVGRGIASAFVATVYGVASANLFFLPAGSKLRAQTREMVRIREVMLEGVLCIVEGLNPKLIRTKLEAYEAQSASAGKKAKQRSAAPASSPVSAEG
jgi:chemotaxis protein MotA